jgi:hypothetical protein
VLTLAALQAPYERRRTVVDIPSDDVVAGSLPAMLLEALAARRAAQSKAS